jgi:hypothetical protein
MEIFCDIEKNKKQCFCCREFFLSNDNDNLVLCENKSCIICKKCIGHQINSQLEYTNIGDFNKNKRKIICEMCKCPFSDRNIIQYMTDEMYEILCCRRNDILKSEIEIECEKKSKINSETEIHVNHICENILTLHCKNCNAAFLDFVGCFSIKCEKCKNHFCGWCCETFENSSESHNHVKNCIYSKNNGDYHGSFAQFTSHHIEKRKNEVIKYLSSIESEEIKNNVFDLISKELSDLKIFISKQEICDEKINNQTIIAS